MKKKLRPLGQIMSDMELLLEEMTDSDKHDMQWQEVLAQVYSWLETHAPHQKPKYLDGTSPEYYFGPRRD
jgi:hypothetical protein